MGGTKRSNSFQSVPEQIWGLSTTQKIQGFANVTCYLTSPHGSLMQLSHPQNDEMIYGRDCERERWHNLNCNAKLEMTY